MINEISQPAVLAGVKQREQWFRDALMQINSRYPIFSEIRGKGLLLGAVLRPEWQGRARDILVAAGNEGLMVLVAGVDVVRFTPSLVIDKADIDEGMQRLETAIATLYHATA